MKAKEVRERSDTELQDELRELEQSLFKLKMQGRTTQNARYAQFKYIRRDIARIRTIQHERLIMMMTAGGGHEEGGDGGGGFDGIDG